MALVRSKFIMLNPSCLIKCFLWSLLLILQGCCPFPGSNGSCTKGHYRPKIEKNTTLYNLRMEMIKRDLVEKMGLQEARAKDTPPNHIPDAILKEFWAETERYDAREQTESSRQVKKLMVHAKKVSDPNCNGCVRFTSTIDAENNNVSYLNLWINQEVTDPGRTKRISVQIHVIGGSSKQLLLRRDVSDAVSGWLNFRISDTHNWVKSKDDGRLQVELLLQFTCSHCRIKLEENTMPLLDVTKEIQIKKRHRRSVTCSGRKKECCLDPFYVEFKDFMGDVGDLILMPKGINIGQCRGSCETGNLNAREHAAFMHAAKSKTSDRISLCCAPLKYKPTAVLIHDKNGGAVVQKDIHDLVVAECGCA